MRFFFSVGEPSGDQHAAKLIHQLRQRRPGAEFIGYGGPEMAKAGCRIDFQLTDLAVMGILRVLPLIWKFYQLVLRADRILREDRPDAVILVDFPGFNWWIARKAKRAGIPVFYYLPPQLWAWGSWRISRVRKFVDHVLCALPFEYDWYAARGISAEFVGHPFFDEVAERKLDPEFRKTHSRSGRRIVGVLPGSRNAEVANNFPVMIDVLRSLVARYPDVQFLVACYREKHRDECRRMLDAAQVTLPVELCVGKTPEIIDLSECCLMVSGSVSLEFVAREKPFVMIYYGSRAAYWFFRSIVHCRFGSLPNLIRDREIVPEFPFAGDTRSRVERMAHILHTWLTDPLAMERVRQELVSVRDDVGQTGASARCSEAILRRVEAANNERQIADRIAA